MAHRIPPRKVTYFEPVPPRLTRNTIIEFPRSMSAAASAARCASIVASSIPPR